MVGKATTKEGNGEAPQRGKEEDAVRSTACSGDESDDSVATLWR
jgi:hypothetical protein